MAEQHVSKITETIIDVPVRTLNAETQPDTARTTMSMVIGTSEAMEQEAASRKATEEVRRARAATGSLQRNRRRARKPQFLTTKPLPEQAMTHSPMSSAGFPPSQMTPKQMTEAALEDEYDKSRGAFFRNLPPLPVQMRLGRPNIGVGEIERSDVMSMVAELVEEEEEEGERGEEGATVAEEREEEEEKEEEEKKEMREMRERLKRVEEKLDRVLGMLGGGPGPAMESTGMEGWWKEVKEE